MSTPFTSPPPRLASNTASGRADLLRLLAQQDAGGVALSQRVTMRDGAHSYPLVFVMETAKPRDPEPPIERLPLPPANSESAVSVSANTLLPRHEAYVYGVVDRHDTDQPAPETTTTQALEKIDLAALNGTGVKPAVAPLVPWPRLNVPLQRFIRRSRPAEIDLPGLINLRCQRAPIPHRLPRYQRAFWPQQLALIIDCAAAMYVYRWDQQALRRWLSNWRGHAGMRVYYLRGVHGSCQRVEHDGHYRPISDLAADMHEGQQVLLMSDLALLGNDSSAQSGWATLIERLRRKQCDLGVLAPMAASHSQTLPDRLRNLSGLPVFCWNAPMQTQRLRRSALGANRANVDVSPLQRLLHMVAPLSQCDIALVRDFRRLHPDLAGDAGVEAQLWQHPHLGREFGYARPVNDTARPDYLQQMVEVLHSGLNDAERGRFWCGYIHLWLTHRTALNQALCYEEALRLQACLELVFADYLDAEHQERWQNTLSQASDFFDKIAPSLEQGGYAHYKTLNWFVMDMLPRMGTATRQRYGDTLARAWAIAYQQQHQRLPDTWPEGLPPSERLTTTATRETWLVQDGDSILWQDVDAQPGQSRLAGPLRCGQIDVTMYGGGAAQIYRLADQPCPIARLGQLAGQTPISVRTATTTLTLNELGAEHNYVHGRPNWAVEWGMDVDGAYALLPRPDGVPLRVDPSEPIADRSIPIKDGEVLRQGVDAYGTWLEFTIKGVTQRLRWLAPGEFLMGSPADEVDRDEDEGPQHKVRLSQGFWLADTACTQGLWHAVMGQNPSRFTTSDEHPVENVSWHDSQQFLKRVNAALGIAGWSFDLPTEAQWEYGCRAGRQSAFCWGNTLSTDLANYNGNYPYAGGEKGAYREETVAVKHFQPNAWGLWQMHGNVREWCADGRREYTAASVTDPVGGRVDSDDGAYVVRGGAWFNRGLNLRAAFRDWYSPGYRFGDFGLRLALRSHAQSGTRAGTAPSTSRPNGTFGWRAPGGAR